MPLSKNFSTAIKKPASKGDWHAFGCRPERMFASWGICRAHKQGPFRCLPLPLATMLISMERYFLGGYFLMVERPLDFGTLKPKTVSTCSDCINDSLVGCWSYSWTTGNDRQLEALPKELVPDGKTVAGIRKWLDAAFEEGRLGWPNVFTTVDAAKEYLSLFFPDVRDARLMAIYVSESRTAEVIDASKPKRADEGDVGIYSQLLKRIPESDTEEFLGYDIIGIEDGGDFHSFHCHDLGSELCERFGLRMNSHGLFEEISSPQPVLDHMNDEANGCEPVPWFICKVKLVPR